MDAVLGSCSHLLGLVEHGIRIGCSVDDALPGSIAGRSDCLGGLLARRLREPSRAPVEWIVRCSGASLVKWYGRPVAVRRPLDWRAQ